MSNKNLSLCVEIYSSMGFGAKKTDTFSATEWLGKHKCFDCWIDGEYIKPTVETVYSDAKLGDVTYLIAEGIYGAKTAVTSSVEAQLQWMNWTHLDQLGVLERISRKLDKKRRLFSDLSDLLGQMDDFELFLDYFNYYSSLLNFECKNLKPVGVVLLILSHKTPNWFSAATVAAALWAGCSIIIKPSRKAPFFPYVLAEVCSEAGLPQGLINVVPGSQKIANFLLTMNVDKIVFSGNCGIGYHMGSKIVPNNFSFFDLGHTSFIIFDSCDVDAAADKLFSETWKYGQQSTWSVDLVVVQEPIYDVFLNRLTSKMENINMENRKIKNCTLEKILVQARNEGVKVFSSVNNSDSDRILITEYEIDVFESDALFTTLLVFKTVKEATDIVNKASYCMGTSIWTQNMAQAMELATKLDTCTIWINCHGVTNASIPVEVLRKSGTDVLGGLEGGLAYMVYETNRGKTIKENDQLILEKTYCESLRGIAGQMHDCFIKWKLNKRRREVLMNVLYTMKQMTDYKYGVHKLIEIINFWSLTGNSYDVIMSSMNYNSNLYAALSKKPVGVIEMVLHGIEDSIETFVSWVTPAIVMGNVVIVVLDEKIYSPLEPIIQCFVKNLPNGVLEIVKGLSHAHQLARDSNIEAVWIQGGNYSLLQDIYSSEKYKCIWSPPSPVPLSKMLLAKHCLKSQAIWFPTIYSPA